MSIMDSAAERFSLPGESVGLARLTLCGDSRLLVERHRGILAYSDSEICIAGGRLRLRIRGEGLHLMAMDGCSLVVGGRIMAIELE